MNENVVEESVKTWLASLNFGVAHGPVLSPDGEHAERAGYGDVILVQRLTDALASMNPKIPASAIDEVARRVVSIETPSLIEGNRLFHKLLIDGVAVEYQDRFGQTIHDTAHLIDWKNADANNWLAVNQYTVVEDRHSRRADVVVFVNGLPLAVIELKNPAKENATVRDAYNQLQDYKREIPSLFRTNAALIISDGLNARIGSISSNWERFGPWRTVDGSDLLPKGMPELEVMIRGVFDKRRFLDLIRNFIVFEDDGKEIIKKLAGYHQYHAVNKAVDCTVQASASKGDRRVGVIWHTQGSGKSLSMVFFAGKVIQHPKMENPTLVVLTDRNDLDGQLFGTFSHCQHVLRQTPAQAESRQSLRELLKVASGGVIFTTIQKFSTDGDKFPLLSDRRNILVIADEAHRSQYDFLDGYARHLRDGLPNASFIGFTGTPIEQADANTRAVFGNYIDVYDIQRAVDDKATVPIYYEGRLAKIELKESQRPKIDPEFEEVTEGQEVETKEKLKSKWARIEAMVGTPERLELIAKDLVEHFDNRRAAMEGKGLIVCMSRRICIDLYNAIIKLRPHWHNDDDAKGFIKVVMTGGADDPKEWEKHARTKGGREALAKRFKNPKDGEDERNPTAPVNPNDCLRLVIVRDMWLTGFDVPCLHTMYVDKPMRGHGLMQAIARVNRVFKDKPGGLVVDYIGIADQLRKALATYTEEGGKGTTAIDQEEAVGVMLGKYENVVSMLHGFDWRKYFTTAATKKLSVIQNALEHILPQEDGATRFVQTVTDLSHAFALSVPHEKAMAICDDVAFFQLVRVALRKVANIDGGGGERGGSDLDTAIRQIISQAVSSREVIDIFAVAGLQRPNLSILSDEFLAEIRGMPQKNLALEMLKKLLNDEIKIRAKKNLVQSRSFTEMLERTIRSYQTRTIETAQVIEHLIELAKDMRAAHQRGVDLKLTEDETAFYDALEVNDSAVKVLGDDTLRDIARELVETVRKNVSIDWTSKDSVKAKLRSVVKRLLRKYGYPPDKQERATQTVLEQAELLCKDWVS